MDMPTDDEHEGYTRTVVEKMHAQGELALEGVDFEALLLQAGEELPELLRRLLRGQVVAVDERLLLLLLLLRDHGVRAAAVAVAVGLVV